MPAQGQPVHDHDCGEGDCGVLYSLYKEIDIPKVSCLNEHAEGACQRVFKSWSERLDFSGEPLKSDADDDAELLLHIPFDGEVRIKAFSVIGGPEGTTPGSVKLFTNQDGLDFSTINDVAPTQEFTLNEDLRGILEYPVMVAKFQGVHSLDMYFPESLGADQLQVYFIGIKGERTQRRREAVTAVYEVTPMADARKVPGTEGNSWGVGM